jgi:hypothetical protein
LWSKKAEQKGGKIMETWLVKVGISMKKLDFFELTEFELDGIKKDILNWKSKSPIYAKTDWIVEQYKRDTMVSRYMIDRNIPEEYFGSFSTVFYTLMSRWWKEPGYWGEVGVEGRNMTS